MDIFVLKKGLNGIGAVQSLILSISVKIILLYIYCRSYDKMYLNLDNMWNWNNEQE